MEAPNGTGLVGFSEPLIGDKLCKVQAGVKPAVSPSITRDSSMRVIVLTFALLACVVGDAEDRNWNQFRGPDADGTSRAKGLPVTFEEGSPSILWKTPIDGRAWSSPVAWGNQIWVSNSPEVQNLTPEMPKLDAPLVLSAVCVDYETGKITHDVKLFEVDKPQYVHPTNTYGSPTPYVEEGRVYVHFGSFGTACVDTRSGKILWKRNDLECNHFRGPGSSAIVYCDLLYLSLDGYDFQYITALNKFTGETVWRRDRDVNFGTTDGDGKKAFSTPVLIEVDGRQLLVSSFAAATIAYDPLTGEPVWTVMHGGVNAAGRPIFTKGVLYINSADGPNPLIALSPKGTGDITENILWRSSKSIPKRPSQIVVDDLIFMMNDAGVASCLDAKTGREIWTKRMGGEYWSSPLYAEGLIYCFSQEGTIPVFKAAREFELVANNHLDDGFLASPAVVKSSLILRSKTHLYRIEKVADAK